MQQNVSPLKLVTSASKDWEQNKYSFGEQGEREEHGVYEEDHSYMAFNEWEREGLTVHNEYRTKHGAPPLRLNRQVEVLKFRLNCIVHITRH